jgi:hypothetical protein
MMIYIEISCRWLLAIVFACSAFAKLHNGASFRGFRSWLVNLPVPVARHAGVAAAAVAAAEVSIVVLAVLPWTAAAGFVIAAVTLAAFIGGTCVAIARGTTASCECFGTSGTRLGWHHVGRDAALLAVAVAGAVMPGARGASAAGIAVSVAAAVILAIFVVFLDDWLTLLALPTGTPVGADGRE